MRESVNNDTVDQCFQEHKEKELLVQRKLDLLLRTGCLLMESSADTSRIMRNMKRTATFLGLPLKNLHIYVNYNMLMVNLGDEEHSFTKFQRVDRHGINFDTISFISKLSYRAIRLDFTLDDYERELDRISHKPRWYNRWQVAVGAGFACGGFCIQFGCDWTAFLYCSLAAMTGLYLKMWLDAKGANQYVNIALAAFVSTLLAWLTTFLTKDNAIAQSLPRFMLTSTPWHPMMACALYIVPGVQKARASVADDQELAEIVVVGGRQSAVRSTTMGSEKFKPQLLKNIPSAFGESDIMKVVLTLPGVTTVGEASSGYNVRGGATDQNLILFNGGTVYNPSHLFGLFTSFNSDAVEDVELFKSSIPVEYGGRISSVLKVTSKEANMQKLTGSASIGALTSKANVEVPIVKDHVSLLLNGRTTYSDWMLKQLPEDSGYKNGSANFYDFSGVLTWKLNSLHRLKIYGYWSHDKFSFSSQDKYGYENRNFSAEWRSLLNERVTLTASAGLDHYDYFNEDRNTPSMAARLSFGIDQIWGKLHVRQRLSEKQVLSYGLSVQHYNVQGGTYEPIGEESCITTDQLQREKALESAAFIDYEHSFTEKLSVSAGLRYSMFNALGPRDVNFYHDGELPTEETLLETRRETGIIKTYHAPEIRLSARYALMENLSLKAGFNTMHQYIHKVSNTSIMSPTDIWKLSDLNIKPQNGWQVAAGIYHETAGKKYEFSAEVYYKHIGDYLNYRSSAVLLMNHHLETDVISTKGRAYGVELQVKKPVGTLNGWVSYTYSRSQLRQDDERVAVPLNNGEWYPSEYDRPHEVKAVLNLKFTERYSFSSNFNYATGRPTTLPAGKYYDSYNQKYMPYYTDRNTYRIPDYMRLDLAFNIEPTHKLTSFLHTSFSIGVYNALARKNAYNVYYVTEGEEIKGYKLSVFGTAIPYVSLNIRFN